jgi:hypothetical protein
LLNFEHPERQRWVKEVSAINDRLQAEHAHVD